MKLFLTVLVLFISGGLDIARATTEKFFLGNSLHTRAGIIDCETALVESNLSGVYYINASWDQVGRLAIFSEPPEDRTHYHTGRYVQLEKINDYLYAAVPVSHIGLIDTRTGKLKNDKTMPGQIEWARTRFSYVLFGKNGTLNEITFIENLDLLDKDLTKLNPLGTITDQPGASRGMEPIVTSKNLPESVYKETIYRSPVDITSDFASISFSIPFLERRVRSKLSRSSTPLEIVHPRRVQIELLRFDLYVRQVLSALSSIEHSFKGTFVEWNGEKGVIEITTEPELIGSIIKEYNLLLDDTEGSMFHKSKNLDIPIRFVEKEGSKKTSLH